MSLDIITEKYRRQIPMVRVSLCLISCKICATSLGKLSMPARTNLSQGWQEKYSVALYMNSVAIFAASSGFGTTAVIVEVQGVELLTQQADDLSSRHPGIRTTYTRYVQLNTCPPWYAKNLGYPHML